MRSLGWRLARRPLSAAAKKDKVLRHPLEWRKADFYSEQGIEEEMRRVLDVCHGCRRCFSLCDSFPILFDQIDASPTEELDRCAAFCMTWMGVVFSASRAES